jgi:hypothetical protein
MPAVAGAVVVAVVAIAISLVLAGPRHVVVRDPTFELKDVASRHVTVLGALAGFAVTAIVFLVTQARSMPDPSGDALTTVLAMFVVAYMGYWSSSVLYANVSHQADDPVFDLAAAQYAGASITLFSLLLGWFALKPLFEAFELDRIASLAGWLLAGAAVVSFGFLAAALHRSGYASSRQIAVLGGLAVAGALGWAVLVGVLAPQLRAPDATLDLTVLAFAVGLPAYAALTVLPVLARNERLTPVLAERWHLAIIAYAQGVTVLVAFLLLSILGLA